MLRTKIFLPLFLLIFLMCPALSADFFGSAAPYDPTRHWKVFETEHFDIIYDENDLTLATSFGNEAERANRLLQPFLKTPMPRRVPVVLADVTDSSNGQAAALPRSQIDIFPVLPAVNDTTSEYYSWPREVIQHEFTHILNFEPTSGIMSFLRFFFGSLIRPGSFLPRWYTEGLAVEMESRLTPVGRGRSHYYSALVRAEVEDGRWGSETIDRIGSIATPTWPRGQRPYVYGYFLMHEMSLLERHDDDHAESFTVGPTIYGVLDHRYGGRIPGFLNGVVDDEFGKPYHELLENMYARLRSIGEGQLKVLKASLANNGEILTAPGYFRFGAQISPDGHHLALIVSDFDQIPAIKIWSRQNVADSFSKIMKESEGITVTTGKEIHQLSWRKDSKHLVFDKSDTWHHYATINDLYDVDTESKKEERLTFGLRAREATVTHDGSLVFVVASSHKTSLMKSGPHGENPTVLVNPGDEERVSSPRPFGHDVIYSHRNNAGREWIEKVTLSGVVKQLTGARKIGEMHVTPMAVPGSPGFAYAASYSGALNIYYSDLTKTLPLTDVTTYAVSPEIDSFAHELIFSRLAANGMELTEVTFVAGSPLASPPAHPPLLADVESYPPADEKPAPQTEVKDQRNYHGLPYLFPQYLFPFLYFVPGGALIDLTTTGNDPLNQHQYSLDIGYDTRASAPQEILTYTNGTLPFLIDAGFANQYLYITGSQISEQIIGGTLDTQHYLLENSNALTAGPEVTYQLTNYAGTFSEAGPGLAVRYNKVTAERDYQISPEGGLSALVAYDYHWANYNFNSVPTNIVGNSQYGALRATASTYLAGGILPKHNVMSLRVQAHVSPPQPSLFIGSQQAGGEYFASLLSPTFLVRGYAVGEFIGWSVYTANFEYRFPIAYPYRGHDIFPLFFNKVYGAIVADTTTLEGGFYNSDFNGNLYQSHLGKMYTGAGAELRTDFDLFYGFPMSMRIGGYYGFTQNAYGGVNYIVSFGSVQ